MGSIFSLLGMFATGNFRKLFSVLLGLALVLGLWETTLANLSSRATATAIMTEVGVELINPVLVDHSFGVSDSIYTALQQAAKAHPTQALAIPGIKVQLVGNEILGKDKQATMVVIYTKVADAYYDGGGLSGVLAVPDQVSQILATIGLWTQAATSQGAQAAGAPQLPQLVSQLAKVRSLLAAIGLSPALFTKTGHEAVLSLQKWLLGAALALVALVALVNKRWQRLTSVCWSLISSAIPGVLVIGALSILPLWQPTLFSPIKGLLGEIRGAIIPVYGGALGAGVAGLILALVGDLILKAVRHGQAAPARAPMPARAPVAAGQRGGWGQAEPGYGQPSYGQPSYGQPEFRRPPVPGAAYADQQPYGQRGYPGAPQPARPNPPPPPNVDTFPWQPGRTSGDRWPAGPTSGDQWPPAQDWNAPDAGPRRSPQPGYGQGGYGQGGYGGQGQGWNDPGSGQGQGQGQGRPPSRGSGPGSWPGAGQQGADDDGDAWPPSPPRRGGY